jgi:hypothetical protein
MSSAYAIGSIESTAVIQLLDDNCPDNPTPGYNKVPKEADEVASTYANINPLLNDTYLHNALHQECMYSKYKVAIGATFAKGDVNLFDTEHAPIVRPADNHESCQVANATQSETQDSSQEQSYLDSFGSPSTDEIYDMMLNKEIDLDDIMVSAVHGGRHQGVKPSELAKLWRIDADTASKTIDITSQRSVRTNTPTLSRNYGTNDRMLRYKHLKEYFFMDTLFATGKANRSSRGNTCAQLFVTDKGFVYIVPMTKESDVLQAVKQFAKAIGAPDAIICDASRAQTSAKVRNFCSDIGTTLRILEENTPWANKAELYIGILKEAVRKDTKEANSPIAFWDYCLERRARINNLTAKNLFSLHSTSPHTALTGEEGDISTLCQHKWYDWCYFREQKELFPLIEKS